MKSLKTNNMFIQVMQKVYNKCCNVILAKTNK